MSGFPSRIINFRIEAQDNSRNNISRAGATRTGTENGEIKSTIIQASL